MSRCSSCSSAATVRSSSTCNTSWRALGTEYLGRATGIVAISSNDAWEYAGDAPDSLKEMAVELGFSFPFCYDETQDVAKAYTAACTPDFFVFDDARRLVYRGQLDDSRPGNGNAVTGVDLRTALDVVLAGRPVSGDQKSSVGCNIKWREGNEPESLSGRAARA